MLVMVPGENSLYFGDGAQGRTAYLWVMGPREQPIFW